MSFAPLKSIVRILTPEHGTAGTGFLVRDGERTLIVTCAHVILEHACAAPGDHVELEPHAARGTPLRAFVEPNYWRDPDREDVSVLSLTQPLPDTCRTITLASGQDTRARYWTWGYPAAKSTDGLAGDVTGIAPSEDAGFPSLSARSQEVSYGFSGGPVWDNATDTVIGMVMSVVPAGLDEAGRQHESFFLRPSSLLWDICPPLLPYSENPYRGLDVFEEQDAELYYGRDEAIRELIADLGKYDLVSVIGISGSGKSSLVRAGLRKGLDKARVLGLDGKPRIRFRPGSVPQLDMLFAIDEQDPANTLKVTRDDDADRARALTTQQPAELAEAIERALPNGAILIVDQFERIFTECPHETTRRHFTDTLLALASPDVKVLLTLRADFYGRVLETPMLAVKVEQGRMTLLAMGREELLAAVQTPARARNRALEPGLAEMLVGDVAGTPGDLPLLQLALTELWARDADSGLLKESSYFEIGGTDADGEQLGIRGVIAQLAERLWRDLSREERQIATHLLVKLVAPAPLGEAADGATQAARRAWQLEWSTDTEAQTVAAKLVDGRLLTAGEDPITGQPTLEVAHEALIRAWPRLTRLAQEHTEFLRWYHTQLAPRLQVWAQEARAPELLLRGEMLTGAERWLQSMREFLQGVPVELIAASAEERLREEEQRKVDSQREREREIAQNVSESIRLAIEARQTVETEPETAFLLAWEALWRDHNEFSDAAFRLTLGTRPAAVQRLRQDEDNDGGEAGFSSDGDVIYASADRSGVIEFWTRSGTPIRTLELPGEGDTLIARRPGAQRLYSYRDGTLRLHADDGTILGELPVSGGPSERGFGGYGLSVSGDGRGLVHLDNAAWLFETQNDELHLTRTVNFVADWDPEQDDGWDETLYPPIARVFGCQLDASGSMIVTDSPQSGVRLWDVDGAPRATIMTDRTASAALLADRKLATGTLDGRGDLWDLTGAHLGTFEAAQELDLYIRAVSSDGHRFATTRGEASSLVVRFEDGTAVNRLSGHQGRVTDADFAPDGELIASAGEDRTVRIWPVASGGMARTLAGHSGAVRAVAFHPSDSRTLLSHGRNGELRLWTLEDDLVPERHVHDDPVVRMITTPLGVISVSRNGTSTLRWHPAGTELRLPGFPIGEPIWHDGGVSIIVETASGASEHCELKDGSCRTRFVLPPDERGHVRLENVVLDRAGRFVAASSSQSAGLWTSNGELVCDLRGRDEHLVEAPHHAFAGIGFNDDGTKVAAASVNGTVWLWGTDGSPLGSFMADHASPDRSFDLATDPLGESIAVAVRERVGLWDWDGNEIGKLRTTGYKVQRVMFSALGSRIVTISDTGHAELWTRDGTRLGEPNQINLFALVAFEASDRYFALPSGPGLTIVDCDGERLGTLAAAAGTHVHAVAISPDGEHVAAAFSDDTLRIWSLQRRQRIISLDPEGIRSVAFTPDSGRILVGRESGVIAEHVVDMTRLYSQAAKRVDRVLSAEELDRYAISEQRLTTQALTNTRQGKGDTAIGSS